MSQMFPECFVRALGRRPEAEKSFFFFSAVQVGKTLHSPRPPDLVLAAHSRFGKTVL